jgi:aspartyl-tRNA(Asn)/glutamyl-tRNA(Gln) amidotransferase subunit C
MKVTEKDVRYVADLAHLELTPEESRAMVRDLSSILDYIGRLNQLDTTEVLPMTQVTAEPGGAVVRAQRDDALRPCLAHEDAMKNAPATDGQFFKVPKVIEK